LGSFAGCSTPLSGFEHVMSHAPGYDRLMKWTAVPILPTPAGEGMMFHTLAQHWKINVIDTGEAILLKPVTEESLKQLQGRLKGKGVLKSLLEERLKDAERE
jgi:hypothetical protein